MRSEDEQHDRRRDTTQAGQKDDKYENRIKLFYGCFKNKT